MCLHLTTSVVSLVILFTDVTWMVACQNASVQPDQCYIDVINIGYFLNNPHLKSDIDMPWIEDYSQLECLKNFTSSPQGILFDLPFLYYVKLVIILFSDHYSPLL